MNDYIGFRSMHYGITPAHKGTGYPLANGCMCGKVGVRGPGDRQWCN